MKKILSAAKRLIRLRCEKAGDWKFYANPSNSIYGPNGGVSFWGGDFEIRQVCEEFGMPYVRYSNSGFAGLVISAAKKMASRHSSFVAHVENWKPVEGSTRCYSDAVEMDFINKFGKIESRQIEAIPCLP